MCNVWRFRAFRWWLVLLSAAVALSLAAARTFYFSFDPVLARHLQTIQAPWFAQTMEMASYVFGSWRFVILVLLAGILVWKREGRRHALLVLAGGLAAYVNSGLKLLVGRPRPSAELVSVSAALGSYSFPSGHTFSAAMLLGVMVILGLLSPRGRIFKTGAYVLAAVVVALVGTSRVYLGVHWPSDIVGSLLWAGVFLIPVYWFVRMYLISTAGSESACETAVPVRGESSADGGGII